MQYCGRFHFRFFKAMRNLSKVLFFLPLVCLAGSAVANSNDIQESFGRSFEDSCVQSIVKRAVTDYSKMTGIASISIPADVRTQLEEVTRPLHTACNCLARKASAKLQSESDKKVEIAIDLSGLSTATDCAPDPATLSNVQLGLMRLVEVSPAPVSALKVKRAPFTVELTLNKSRPSIYASYTRPPESLTKLVFLAPGTGRACTPQNVCVDKSPLKIVRAAELLVSHGSILGMEGSRKLQKVIEQFGADARIITSGSNFSNFATNAKGASYAIRSIDGVPIEKTTVKNVWLVIFASQVPADPRAIEFPPAIVSVFEVEFLD